MRGTIVPRAPEGNFQLFGPGVPMTKPPWTPKRRRAGRSHRSGYLRGYRYQTRIAAQKFNQFQPSASDHQLELWLCEAANGVTMNAAFNSAYLVGGG